MSLKVTQRSRFQVLHDAFFKYQTKPKLTSHGDLYHEGKEFEVYIVFFCDDANGRMHVLYTFANPIVLML